MNNSQTYKSRLLKGTRLALVASAGLAMAYSASNQSEAINTIRISLGISAWEEEGITGAGIVIGDFSGLPSLVSPVSPFGSHRLLANSNPIAIAFEDDGVPRRTFSSLLFHDHQTATAGSMVASGSSSQPRGVAPDGQLLVGWFAIDRDLTGGGFDFRGPFAGSRNSNEQDGIIWTLFAMTDQAVADLLALPGNGYEYAPYKVATVVNASIGNESDEGKRGEDANARMFNAVVTMTDATLICPTGNSGGEDNNSDSDMPELSDLNTVFSPASAANVIAVGSIQRNFTALLDSSGKGPSQARNYSTTASLYPDTEGFTPPFGAGGDDDPSTNGIFREVRSGVDIVAPGDQLNLPGVVFGSGLSTTSFSRLWIGTSFSSSIVAGSVGLLHELGEREGHSISSVVTRAVLLNSANKSDDGLGVGFDNEQTEDSMDDDKPFITMIGLDDEIGAGSLDLKRLLNQYHNGTVMTDIRPGDGLDGYGRTFVRDAPVGGNGDSDSFVYDGTMPVSGTDPNVSIVTPGLAAVLSISESCLQSRSALLDERPAEQGDPWSESNLEWTVAQRYGPFSEAVELLLDDDYTRLTPMGRRDDPPLGDGDRQGTIGGDNGDDTGGIPPAGDDEIPSPQGNTTGPFRSGWDHGMMGEGALDIPIGIITPGSGISVTLTWNRHEGLEFNPIDFAVHNPNLISFPSAGTTDPDGRTPTDPFEMDAFEFEDLNLELWRIEQVGANTLVAASRGVWNNTECVYFVKDGGGFDSSSDGAFGNAPANYFIRISFVQTLWDYGGFTFCSGGDLGQPTNSIPKNGFVDRTRAEVEFGLAWYVDFNVAGVGFLGSIDQETGAVNVGIPGLIDNVDRQFISPVSDINSDLIVDANDAALMIRNFGSTDPDFDVNSDGIADALDLEMIAISVGEVAEVRKLTKEEKKANKLSRKAYKKTVKDRRRINKKASKKQKKLRQ